MSRDPLDFYQQFIWRGIFGCTRCGALFTDHKDMVQHCKNQDCKPVEDKENIEWLN